MKKRIFAVFAIFLLAVLSSCGGGGDNGVSGTDDDGTTVVSENPDPLDPEGDLDGDGIANENDDDADADGSKSDVDCNDLDASINPDESDYPDGKGDTNCDGMDGDADAVYVSMSEGNDANAGSLKKPVQNILKGLELAAADKTNPKDIYVVEGNYKEDVWLTDNVNMFGGFSPLVDGARTRDVAAHYTFIDGAYDTVKPTFTGKSSVMDFNCALFIDGSDSIVDGFGIEGSKDGAVVYIRNSSATVSNSIIKTYKPTVSRKTSFGIIVTIDGDSKKDQVVAIEDNEIHLFGTEDKSEMEFGIISIPEKDADLSLKLEIDNNKISAEGRADATLGVFVADDQGNPENGSKTGDGKANISLDATNNRFEMSGDINMVAAVVAGGLGISNPPIPATEQDFYLSAANVSNNIISITNPVMSVGVSVMDVRDDSLISNNVIMLDNSTSGGGMGIVSTNARSNIYYNTLNMGIHDGGYGLTLFSSEGPSDEYKLYSKFQPKNVYNNVFSVIADPNCSMIAGVMETGDDAAISYYSSPNEFKNNDIYMPVECSDPSKSVFYADTFSPLTLIQVGSDLNDESKYAASNPTVFDGNIFEDPKFTDASNGDLSLKSSSPCIDTGLGFEDGWSDMLGSARPVGAGVDMGAIEQ